MVLEQQATLKWGENELPNILNAKEVEIAKLKSELQKVISNGPCTCQDIEEFLRKLRTEKALLLIKNASLVINFQNLNKQLIKAH